MSGSVDWGVIWIAHARGDHKNLLRLVTFWQSKIFATRNRVLVADGHRHMCEVPERILTDNELDYPEADGRECQHSAAYRTFISAASERWILIK